MAQMHRTSTATPASSASTRRVQERRAWRREAALERVASSLLDWIEGARGELSRTEQMSRREYELLQEIIGMAWRTQALVDGGDPIDYLKRRDAAAARLASGA